MFPKLQLSHRNKGFGGRAMAPEPLWPCLGVCPLLCRRPEPLFPCPDILFVAFSTFSTIWGIQDAFFILFSLLRALIVGIWHVKIPLELQGCSLRIGSAVNIPSFGYFQHCQGMTSMTASWQIAINHSNYRHIARCGILPTTCQCHC